MLQALRFCLVGAGEKMSVVNRKQLMPVLIDFMRCAEDSTRAVASGCVGVLCLSLTEEELADLLIQQLLGKLLLFLRLQLYIRFCKGLYCQNLKYAVSGKLTGRWSGSELFIARPVVELSVI